jgi:DNA modification methylase
MPVAVNTSKANSKFTELHFPINEIINGDAVEELKKLPSESIDLVVADPPYWKVVNEKWDYQWGTEQAYIALVRRVV